jgi:hypothetical protein
MFAALLLPVGCCCCCSDSWTKPTCIPKKRVEIKLNFIHILKVWAKLNYPESGPNKGHSYYPQGSLLYFGQSVIPGIVFLAD